MKNAQVEASLNIFKTIEGVPLLRLAQIEGYILRLEKENSELDFFFDKINKVVREYTWGDDAA